MKIWIDDVRPAPESEGYITCKSVNLAKKLIKAWESGYICNDKAQKEELIEVFGTKIEFIDIDYDAGDYVSDGGDYIKLLDWLEETGRNYPIRIHSMNPVGIESMRRIIQKNGWIEVK